MKIFLGLVLYLVVGFVACVISMFVLSWTVTGASREYDLSPLAGLVIGAPVWLISFPICFFIFMSKMRDFTGAFVWSSGIALLLTVIIPLAFMRLPKKQENPEIGVIRDVAHRISAI